MAYFTARDRLTLTTMLSGLGHPVQARVFSRPGHELGDNLIAVLQEVADISRSQVTVITKNIQTDLAEAILFEVQEVPTLILCDRFGDDGGTRRVGLPTGYQFGALVQQILDISRHRPRLRPHTMSFLHNLDQDVLVTVAVSPTCPHSPRATRLGHLFALANPSRVRTTIIDATQYPDWARIHAVNGVPTVLVTVPGRAPARFEGAPSEDGLLELIRRTLRPQREKGAKRDGSSRHR